MRPHAQGQLAASQSAQRVGADRRVELSDQRLEAGVAQKALTQTKEHLLFFEYGLEGDSLSRVAI
jgi:hypothetical protein